MGNTKVAADGGRPVRGGPSGGAMVDERLAILTGRTAVVGGTRQKTKGGTPAQVWSAVCPLITPIAMVAAGSAAVVALAFVDPIAYHIPTLRATVETAITLLALTAAAMVHARFVHTARVRDLLRLTALLMLAVFELGCNALPSALGLHSSGQFGATRMLGDLLVAATFAASAFTPAERLATDRRRALTIAGAGGLAACLAAGLGGLLLRPVLATAAGHPVSGLSHALHRPLACIVVLATTVLLICAAVAFVRSRRVVAAGGESLIAGGLVLLAAARVYYFAVPAVSPMWVSPREGLRLLALALLLAAAVRQELKLRARSARAAALAERRRVAQDLHDGIAQDLAFIAAHSVRMATELGEEHPVTVAARRALTVSRGTISELTDMSSTTVDEALEAVAHELRDRFEIGITVYVHPEAQLAPSSREHVARIAREAIANAARHGLADNVTLSLRPAVGAVMLCVRDDGCGIAPTADGDMPEGFGLRSMRDRAAALGGHLTVQPRRSGGTELEVVLPR
jgi:signal transduction histidine kinase